MHDFLRSLLTSPLVRSYALAAARHAATSLGAILSAWLISKGVQHGDAASLGEGIGALVVPTVSIMFSMLDVKKVDAQVKATRVETAAVVADGIRSGATTPDAIIQHVNATVISPADGNAKLQAALAALKAGAG